MKPPIISLAAVAVASAVAYAAENRPVPVCVQHRETANNIVMGKAQVVVTAIFAQAGVRIDWLPSRLCRIAALDAIRLEIDMEAPAHFSPETLAYALPYAESGTTIHVFYNRIMEGHRELCGELLGHVIAHEMGHVLEGIARHSPDGLMKARWELHDYLRMKRHHLSFSTEDVELMRNRLMSLGRLTAQSGRE
jgi:hypothetical protein